MTQPVRITLAQLNLTVGDIQGNLDKILDQLTQLRGKTDLILLPELSLVGYPPEDLLYRGSLPARVDAALDTLRQAAGDICVVVGHPRWQNGLCYNSASAFYQGQCLLTYDKQALPNYGVFDERRYFIPGQQPGVFEFKGRRVGVSICEDIWQPESAADLKAAGAQIILNLNASPFHLGKQNERTDCLIARAKETGLPIFYCNMVGGQDELVFDGGSQVVNGNGECLLHGPVFEQASLQTTWHPHSIEIHCDSYDELSEEAMAWKALVLAVRDYVGKNGFPGVLIGLSGGIDSALTLCIAVDALGADRVEAVMMPFKYTSEMSRTDAAEQANWLGVKYSSVSIEPIYEQFMNGLSSAFAGLDADTTEENLQARIRGTLLMSLSNKTGKMVLATSNKSEVAVGYSTLYGDMVGGFTAIKDIPKTMVYRLSEYRNSINAEMGGEVGKAIPQRVITRPPSAELAPGQVDQDSLPDYEILDQLIDLYVDQDMGVEDIIAKGYDAAVVQRIARLVDRNEYKRRQAAPGAKITSRAFGRERRYPITSGYSRS
ncbi:NAD+ synthase [Pelagibaculum spongiae]|uniref:Glutamine-dependent NAD(+) synthetase n=1 Tax=Pelagibaculum spongiae TaxID=2080658 RepID=A0A2V1GQA8_9GAMM|nr:NAD+ synthase [Pelagibaculum spongiae]PVZ63536.1 NAD+ synthase [Pelagibaculum spongiae]